jgi:hypothetical protein
MAKKQTASPAAVADPATEFNPAELEQPATETTAIATTTKQVALVQPKNEALQVLDSVNRDDKSGLEQADAGDLILPRLALCQSNSPQRKRGNEKFIQGLDEGMMFNSLTGDVYGESVPIIPISLNKRAMQFRPMEEGGGIIDRNVPFNDPRCEYDNTKEGKEAKPLATRMYDWLVYLPESAEFAVVSFKGTSEKTGKKLVTLTSMRPGPPRGQLYTLGTAAKHENNYDWHIFTVVPAGKPSADDAEMAESGFKRFGTSARYDEEQQPETPAGDVRQGEVVDEEL